MQSLCLSVCSSNLLSNSFSKPLLNISPLTTTLFNPFRLSINKQKSMMSKKRGGMRSSGAVCSSSALLSPRNLQCVSAVASVILMLVKGELELPFATLVLVLVAPRQAMNLRGTQAGILASLAIGAYLAFEHFMRVGGLQKSFNQGSIVATLAVICASVVPFLLLI